MSTSTPPIPAPPQPGPGRAPRPSWHAVIWLLALAVLAGGGWWAWRAWGAPAPADELLLSTVQRGDIEDLVGATGSLQPREYVDVGAQVSGQLEKIHVDVGDSVQAGQLLAEIAAEQAAARVDANRASLRAQQAGLTERRANLAQAQRDLQRQRNLEVEDATTVEQVENAQTAVNTAQAQIEALQAQIQQAQASMRVEEANLRFTKIYAPMAGTVVSVVARQGQTLNANQSAPTLLRIADLSTMTVQTAVSEADVSKLRQGMPSYFTTLGGQGRRWNGTLRKIEPTPTVTNNVVLYNALFDVPNTAGSLMSNMTAQVFFVVAEVRDVLVVPMSALTLQRTEGSGRGAPVMAPTDGAASDAAGTARAPASASRPRTVSGGAGAGTPVASARRDAQGRAAPRRATVQMQSADGSLQSREVLVGASNRVSAEILSGLQEGERVVTGVKQPSASGAQRSNVAGGAAAGGLGGLGGPTPGGAGGGRR